MCKAGRQSPRDAPPSGQRLPAAYLTVDRTQQAWVDLRDALACERVYDEYGGDPLDTATSQLLSACKSDSTVAAALYEVDTNLAAVQTAWNAAVAD